MTGASQFVAQAFVYQMLMLNNVTDLVMMRERVVTEEDEAVVPMQVRHAPLC
jgi:hypothetical protein